MKAIVKELLGTEVIFVDGRVMGPWPSDLIAVAECR